MKKLLTNKEQAKKAALKDMKQEHIFPIVPKHRNFENGIITFMQI